MKFRPELHFRNSWPQASELKPDQSLLIFDRRLLKFASAKNWIRQFPFLYPVSAGEQLKEIRAFPKHMEKIIRETEGIPQRPLQIICLGGGSVGDFAGFAASILKRGVKLVQIPSTWLAAMDSAHGGKNALNSAQAKNQIGTFHFASEVFLIRPLLFLQPAALAQDALGEALKISLIEGGSLWKKISLIKIWNEKTLWLLLPRLIEAKYKVVQKDPFESRGIRQTLNFGHTLGHVFETQLKLSHGQAVLSGLGFALQFSHHKKILSRNAFSKIQKIPRGRSIPLGIQQAKLLKKLKLAEKQLSQDKKRVSSKQNSVQVRFVFLRNPGKTIIRPISLPDLLTEIKRQIL